jgi:hypothetical protein
LAVVDLIAGAGLAVVTIASVDDTVDFVGIGPVESAVVVAE